MVAVMCALSTTKVVFVSVIDCPKCLGAMLWSHECSRWECRCGKTIARHSVSGAATGKVSRVSEAQEIRVDSLPSFLQKARRLANACPVVH